MIDTDKYEGHIKKLRLDEGANLHIVVPPNGPVGAWNEWKGGAIFDLGEKAVMGECVIVTARLMAAAPDLLAEVKRLRALLINTFWDGVSGIKEQDERTHDGLVKEYMELIG